MSHRRPFVLALRIFEQKQNQGETQRVCVCVCVFFPVVLLGVGSDTICVGSHFVQVLRLNDK